MFPFHYKVSRVIREIEATPIVFSPSQDSSKCQLTADPETRTHRQAVETLKGCLASREKALQTGLNAVLVIDSSSDEFEVRRVETEAVGWILDYLGTLESKG